MQKIYSIGKVNVGSSPSVVIDFGKQETGVPFSITTEQMQQLLAEEPPVVQVTINTYQINLYRFDRVSDAAYYTNVMYFDGRKYYINMSAQGTQATITSLDELEIPAPSQGDAGKVLMVGGDGTTMTWEAPSGQSGTYNPNTDLFEQVTKNINIAGQPIKTTYLYFKGIQDPATTTIAGKITIATPEPTSIPVTNVFEFYFLTLFYIRNVVPTLGYTPEITFTTSEDLSAMSNIIKKGYTIIQSAEFNPIVFGGMASDVPFGYTHFEYTDAGSYTVYTTLVDFKGMEISFQNSLNNGKFDYYVTSNAKSSMFNFDLGDISEAHTYLDALKMSSFWTSEVYTIKAIYNEVSLFLAKVTQIPGADKFANRIFSGCALIKDVLSCVIVTVTQEGNRTRVDTSVNALGVTSASISEALKITEDQLQTLVNISSQIGSVDESGITFKTKVSAPNFDAVQVAAAQGSDNL